LRAIHAAVLMCTACAPSSVGGQTISVYVDSGVSVLDPHHALTFAEHAGAGILHRGLTQYDSEGRLVPGLADTWSVDSSGTRYVFELASGLTWSDGRPLTAADVVAGIHRALDPARPAPFARHLSGLANADVYMNGTLPDGEELGVSAPDTRTVVFVLNDPDYTFPAILALPVAMPAPAYNPDSIADGAVTSGSNVAVRDQDENVILRTRSGDGRFAIRVADSADAAWAKTDTDDHFVTADMPIITVPAVGARGDDIRQSGGQALYSYVVNTARPPLNTLEARHALAMAISRAALLDRVPVRDASPALEFVPPRGKTYETSYKTPYASLTEEEREAVAEALLADAGYMQGHRFTVRLRVPSGDVHLRIAEAVADQWARARVSTEIVVAPFPEHWRSVADGDFDVAFAVWPGPRDTPRTFLEPLSARGGPWNFGRYTFEGLDERLTRAARSEKPNVQAQYYREAEKVLIEDQSLFALFYYRPLSLVSANVSGWRSNPSGMHPLGALSVKSMRSAPVLVRPDLPPAAPSLSPEN
jgi:oligopeptide transport system substrate-binding protein